MEQLELRWSLENIYPGGSESAAFAAELDGLARDIEVFERSLHEAGDSPVTGDLLGRLTQSAQSILARLREAESFTACLTAADVADRRAAALDDRVKNLAAAWQAALTLYDRVLGDTDEETWNGWLTSAGGPGEAAFYVAERRERAKEKLPPEQEALAGDLAVDGFHAWGELYNTIVGRTRFRAADETGEVKTWSAGQMQNLLYHGNRDVRRAAFESWETEWERQAELCAEVLNRIAGFRLKLYGRRGWDSVLKEPLDMNRMRPETLEAMWAAVDESRPALLRYLRRKAELLGLERLDWHDVDAPIGSAARTVPFDEAAAFIVDRFRQFSPDMAGLAERAFRARWIEAEDRAGKRPGGFCTSFPIAGETRIFMTYSGTASNVSTLAHELGHAYHQHVMNDLPAFAQEYAMNVAETASTFAEWIVSDSAVRAAADPAEKLALLDDQLQRAVAFFMNIRARFLFETRFYERRREGLLSADELCVLMEEAQREAYGDALGAWHPHFWASKLHFYMTEVPFYNFPYTFGFLFSSGICARVMAEGPAFAGRYAELLRDTGSMTVEDLAWKHLGVRLDDIGFWREAAAVPLKDVDTFLALAP